MGIFLNTTRVSPFRVSGGLLTLIEAAIEDHQEDQVLRWDEGALYGKIGDV